MIAIAYWSALTVALYLLAVALARRFGDVPWLSPIVTTSGCIIAMLWFFRVAVDDYERATTGITFLLGPATVALAVPLFRELHAVRKDARAVAIAILGGSATAAISAVVIAHLFGCDLSVVRSLASKSVTTPVAMAVSAQIGGIPALSAVFAVLSGVVGAMLAPFALRRWPARITGLAMGTSAHGVGTARLYALDKTAAAFSGLAMGLNALLTACVLPPIAAIVERMSR